MALDDTTMEELVDRFVVSRSGTEGATARGFAEELRISETRARELLQLFKDKARHVERDAAYLGTARFVLFAKTATPADIEVARGAFLELARRYRSSQTAARPTTREAISQQLERAEHALFRGDLAEAGRALHGMGRAHDKLSKQLRLAYAARQSIASANAAMQAGEFKRAEKISEQFRNHALSLDQRLELTATYGAALRMNPARLKRSVEIYTEGIRAAEEAGSVGRARLRHLLTARSAPLAALGHAREAVADLHEAVALAPDHYADTESRLCRVRALYIAGDLRGAERFWPDVLPAGAPLWLDKWHKRFRLAFLPETNGPDEWNSSAMQVWSDNKDHGFQRRLIAAMVLRSPHTRREAWSAETWAQLEHATAGVAPDSLFLAT